MSSFTPVSPDIEQIHRNYLLFVGSARWIKRIIALSPISTTNTIDMLISMMIKGFVVTGCPISSPLFRLILAQPAAYIPFIGISVQTHRFLPALSFLCRNDTFTDRTAFPSPCFLRSSRTGRQRWQPLFLLGRRQRPDGRPPHARRIQYITPFSCVKRRHIFLKIIVLPVLSRF